MSDTVMALGESELERIGDYVRGNLYGWLTDVAPQMVVGPQLLERSVRIEEELKQQREIMDRRFAESDRRFAELSKQMNRGFDDVNRRFDDVNRRFDDVNLRFEDVNLRFEDMNKRFDESSRQTSERFAEASRQTSERFAELHKRFNGLQWMIMSGFAFTATLIAITKFVS
jgi:hypothetical protein